LQQEPPVRLSGCPDNDLTKRFPLIVEAMRCFCTIDSEVLQ